nr:MAG TPA: Terminase small subunit [Caudoviricetes sp.]
MTDKQRKFCDEYLIDCNATRAYKVAYPNIKNDNVASAAGTRLLGNVKIKAYIDTKLEEMSSAKVASAEEVMKYLTSVMRGECTEQIPLLIGEGIQKLADKDIGAKERLKAAELIGKRYGLFSDKVNFEGTLPVMIVGEDNLEE